MSGSEFFQTKVGAFTGHIVNLRRPVKYNIKTNNDVFNSTGEDGWKQSSKIPFSDNLFDVLLNSMEDFSSVHWMICVCKKTSNMEQ